MVKKICLFILFIGSGLVASAHGSSWLHDQSLAFSKDSATVEKNFSIMVNKNYSTFGLVDAAKHFQKYYNKLFDTYYKQTISALKNESKDIVLVNQQKWDILFDTNFQYFQSFIHKTSKTIGAETINITLKLNTLRQNSLI